MQGYRNVYKSGYALFYTRKFFTLSLSPVLISVYAKNNGHEPNVYIIKFTI